MARVTLPEQPYNASANTVTQAEVMVTVKCIARADHPANVKNVSTFMVKESDGRMMHAVVGALYTLPHTAALAMVQSGKAEIVGEVAA